MTLDKLTNRTKEGLFAARELAVTSKHTEIMPEHLFTALFDQPEGVLKPIVNAAGADSGGAMDGFANLVTVAP